MYIGEGVDMRGMMGLVKLCCLELIRNPAVQIIYPRVAIINPSRLGVDTVGTNERISSGILRSYARVVF